MRPIDLPTLRAALDAQYDGFNAPNSALDPVHLVRRYPDRRDQEIVGFCAAGLAFGRVSSVMQSVERVLAVLGRHPAEFVRAFDPLRDAAGFESFVHRWIRGRDVVALLVILRDMLNTRGSLEQVFLDGLSADAADVGEALESFSTRARAVDLRVAYGRVPQRAGVYYFFPRPSAGSACKRLNLFLRWMVRADGVDMGTWTRVPSRLLVVPLDTHIVRLGQCLALTNQRTPGWRMAASVTASLRRLDARDPVKYDYALCHLGMMGACGFRQKQADSACPLRGHCRPRARRRAASQPPSARR